MRIQIMAGGQSPMIILVLLSTAHWVRLEDVSGVAEVLSKFSIMFKGCMKTEIRNITIKL